MIGWWTDEHIKTTNLRMNEWTYMNKQNECTNEQMNE